MKMKLETLKIAEEKLQKALDLMITIDFNPYVKFANRLLKIEGELVAFLRVVKRHKTFAEKEVKKLSVLRTKLKILESTLNVKL